jgi:uncharacterized repeat protein (TIGR01451 family)
MKYLLNCKNVLFFIFHFSFNLITAQCDWEAIGPDDDIFFIEDGSSNYQPSITFDNNGFQYIAFSDVQNGSKISVKRFVNGHWSFLGLPGFSAGQADLVKIATDNLNRVYVAYKDYSNNHKITVQFYNGFSWSVVGMPGIGADTVIEMDFAVDKTTNHPFIYYTDSVDVSTVMEYNGSSWNVIGSSNFGAVSMYDGKLSTNNGIPYLSFITYTPYQLNLLAFNGSAWASLGSFSSSFVNASWCSAITFDNNNVPYVAFHESSLGQPSVMYLNGSNWTNVGAPGVVPYATWYNTLAFDQANNVYLSYTKATASAAEIAKYNGSSWSVISSYLTPGNTSIPSQYAYYKGMSIDPLTDDLYLIYTENTVSPLVGWKDFGVMKYNGTSAKLTGNVSITGPVTTTGSAKAYFDFDKFGTAYVAYSDSTYSDKVSVKKYVGNAWVYVGTPGFNTGYTEWAKIAFDTLGVPYVAFRQDNADIYVMKFNGTSWVYVGTVITNTYDISLAINPITNQPHIFYCDVNNGLRGNVKKFNGSSWISEGPANFTIGSAAYTNIKFDNLGNQYVAYSDNGLGIKSIVKLFNGTNWVTVGSGTISAAQAHQTKFKIDAQNNLYIVYLDQSTSYQPLCHKFDGANWQMLGSYVTTGYVSDADVAVDNTGNVFVYYTQQYLNYYPGTVKRFFNGSWIPAGRQYIANASCKSNQIEINPVNNAPCIGSLSKAGPSVSLLSTGFFIKSLPCNFNSALMGKVVYDANGDCINNSGEQNLVYQSVALTQGTNTDIAFTDNSGNYYFTGNTPGSYTVGMGNLTNGYNVQCAASLPHNTTIVSGTLTTENFSVACTPEFDIIANSIIPLGNWWPNQTVKIHSNIIIQKTICSGGVTPGIVRLIFPSCLKYVADSTLPLQPSSVSVSALGDTVWYSIPDVYNPSPYFYNSVITSAHICSTATITDTLCIQLDVTANNDVNLTNNLYSRCIAIAASYDPNYKEVMPKGLGQPGFISNTTGELLYTIHFQNTGTAPAVNIKVVDTLSQNLDLSTFQIVSSSHYMAGNSLVGGVMTFNFPNIMLPDSTSDLLNSMGYVTYKISLKPGLIPITEIKNTAYIYFDFNPPIITNTTLNTIEIPLEIENVLWKGDNSVLVYPNPFNTNTTFVINSDETDAVYTFELYDVLGKKVNELTNITSKQFNLTRSGLENGMYFYKIYTSEKLIGNGKLIIK